MQYDGCDLFYDECDDYYDFGCYDGGFGKEHMPAELDTHRDINKLGDVLSARGYSDDDIASV